MPIIVGELCFVHTAKAAGSVIASNFGIYDGESIFINDTVNKYEHNPPHIFPKFSITNIRNPLEMWVSSWAWGCSDHPKSGGLRSQMYKKKYTYAQDIEGFRKWANFCLDNLIEVNSYRFAPIFCVTNIGALQSQRVMQSCAGNLDNIDYFIKKENIKEDFKEAVILSLEPLKENWEEIVDRNFKKIYKKTPHLPYEEYYTDELKRKVLEKEILFKRWYPELFEVLE